MRPLPDTQLLTIAPLRDDCGGSLTCLVSRADQTIDNFAEQWDRMGQL